MSFLGNVLRAGIVGGASLIPGVGAVAGPAAAALVKGYDSRKKKQMAGQPGVDAQSGMDTRGAAPGSPEVLYRSQFDDRLNREGEIGDRFTNDFEKGITSFNPGDYAKSTATAVGDGLYEDLMQRDLGRRQTLNRRGWGPAAGLGIAQQGRDFNTRLSREVAGLGMQAAGMEQSRLGMVGDYGARARDTALEGSFDRYATERAGREEDENRAEREKADKRGFWGSVGGAALGTAGTVLGSYLSRR